MAVTSKGLLDALIEASENPELTEEEKGTINVFILLIPKLCSECQEVILSIWKHAAE